MDYAVLENSALFRNIPAKDIQADLDAISWHIRRFDRDDLSVENQPDECYHENG